MDKYSDIQNAGAEVCVVSFAPPNRVAVYIERYPLPFPAYSDPDRKAYEAFALDRITWGEMFRPRVIWGYLKHMFRGWMPWRKEKGADLLQLGGDFLIGGDRQLLWSYRSAEPNDRPTVEAILDAVVQVKNQ